MKPSATPAVGAQRSAAALLGVLALAAAAYWPGTSGTFLFDDYANLYRLEALTAEPSAYGYLQYVLGGESSSLGRPLAHLTFALQHASWDRDPADFLRVNVLLHLFNTLLWFGVVSRLQRLQALPAAPLLPAAAAALWAFLPIHGGAVLYVVQRMALLSGTCVLGGLLLYLAGREAAARRPARGLALMSLGAAGGTALGTLAKESAALLPALILVLEAALLRTRAPGWRAWSAVFLWLPTALLAGYLWHSAPALFAGYEHRPFTAPERLLTEARLLFLYLFRAFLPSPAGIRFHYDDVALSTSWHEPWTTALALAGWLGLFVAAVHQRRRAPLLAFAVGWYIVGHALESTFLPLELAFDHRNYVPALGPALALAAGGWRLLDHPAAARLRGILGALALVYLALLGAGTWLSADLWGRPLEQARYWVERQPDSRRAVYHLADLLDQGARHGEAAALYRRALARWPDDATSGLALLALTCRVPDPGIDGAAAAAMLRDFDGRTTIRVVGTLDALAGAVERGHCPRLAPQAALQVVDAALTSRWLEPERVLLHYAAARLLRAAGEPAAALARLEQALAFEPQVPLLQLAVTWSLEAGDAARARRHLATAEDSPRIPAHLRWTYREEIRGTRQLIELYESLERAAPA